MTLYAGISIAGALIAFALEAWVLLKKESLVMVAIGSVLVIVAVFIARLVFYALQISVGLQ
jgi:anaerobic dimethyl sulfoxide reductase subunit C (anchor subunit)/Tat-targeted selenate reductase subunit YnfH